MNLAALLSGGKDSTHALWLQLKEGHSVTHLVAMLPENENSWMFHKPKKEYLTLFSETSKIPLKKARTKGEKERELEDLRKVLKEISVDGIISGALASNYQKSRIESICDDLDLKSLTPIWKKDPEELLEDMIEEGFEIIITSVSAGGMGKDWLGRRLDREALLDLKKLNEEYGIHLTGEGGEYETLVLDAPFFEKRIEIEESDKVWKGERGKLEIKGFELRDK